MRRLPILLASALLATATLACGGDDGTPSATPSPTTASPSPTPTPMTKEAWIAAVNPICARVEKESEAIAEPKTAQDWLNGTQTYLASLKKAQAEMRGFPPPAADAAAIETNFLAVGDAQIAILERLVPQLEAAAAKNDTAAAEKAANEGFEEYEKAASGHEDWAEQYGLTSCV